MVDVIGENHPDMSEETEVGLKAIATVEKSPENGNATIVGPSASSEVDDGGSSETGGHSDINEDSGSSSFDFEVAKEVVEEEMVELKLEKMKPKLETCSMHCPNCRVEVTRVVLRRKVITFRPPEPPVVPVEPTSPMELIVEPNPIEAPDLSKYISWLGLFTRDNETNGVPMDFISEGTWLGYEGILAVVEILKSIVYGGLLVLIVSLSVVVSAAASNTVTHIIAFALASLIGGSILIWHNVWNLRNDCYKENTKEQIQSEAINKYEEIFGRIKYFPLHAFFAILSFLIFGMAPPVAYGFLFYKTNDRDLTMLLVAIMSLLCVAVLALFKALFNGLEYFKPVVYYITITVSASSVSYVAGHLVMRLVKEFGLFDTSSGGGCMPLVPNAATTYLTSF